MNLEKLNPWNWFKHESNESDRQTPVPVTRSDSENLPVTSNLNSLLSLQRDIERLFTDAFASIGSPSLFRSGFPRTGGSGNVFGNAFETTLGAFNPKIDISGEDKAYEVVLDVPGMKQEDISIELKGDLLVIKGQKEEKSENKEKQFYRVERSYGSFQRTLSLPEDANAEDISANLKDGVLKLTIPRVETDTKDIKKIPISN